MIIRNILAAGTLALILAVGVGQTIESAPAPESGVARAEPLTDGKIAMIAVVANDSDIAYAHLALALSSDPAVRSFAKTMLMDHAAVNDLAGALAGELGIEPAESEISRQLLEQRLQIIDELTTLRGAAFDKRYAGSELAYHEFVNSALREQFIPAAQSPEFRAALEQALTVFEGHERLAQEMVRSVNQ